MTSRGVNPSQAPLVFLLVVACGGETPRPREAERQRAAPEAEADMAEEPARTDFTPPAVRGDEEFEAETRDEEWASEMEEVIRREFGASGRPRVQVACRRGRCRIRLRAPAMDERVQERLRLPECLLREVSTRGELRVWFLDCFEEDEGWAARTEAEVRHRVEAWSRERSETASLLSVECRSRRCRFVMRYPDLEAGRNSDLNEELRFEMLENLQRCGGTISGLEPGPRGSEVLQTVLVDCSGDEEGWRAEESQYEHEERAERRLARFRSEPRDEAWAPQMERDLRTEVEAQLDLSGDGFALALVECAPGRCTIGVRYPRGRPGEVARRLRREVFAIEGCVLQDLGRLDPGPGFRLGLDCRWPAGASAQRGWERRTKEDIERRFAAFVEERGRSIAIDSVECRTTTCRIAIRNRGRNVEGNGFHNLVPHSGPCRVHGGSGHSEPSGEHITVLRLRCDR